MIHGPRALVLGLLVAALAAAPARAAAGPIALVVDASEAPRRILHARLTMPASAGPMTLTYPKWIPGEHGPTGPIAGLAGPRISAGGTPIAWRRDPVEMYAFHLDVPDGAPAIQIEFDVLLPVGDEGFTSSATSSAQLAVISWNQVVLQPGGTRPEDLVYRASLRLPPGWRHGTALTAAREAGGTVEFSPVTLSELVDSPVLIGRHFRRVALGEPEGIPHFLDMAADSEAALEPPPEWEAALRKLVAEAGALFGARHYRRYHFLLTLSDHVAHFGLEHHESSDNRVHERTLVDADPRRLHAGLLTHEFVHSWNGKHRRPAGLATGDFATPMNDDLLWIYEGLTQYLGEILAARSGFVTPGEFRESLAAAASELDRRGGRRWRPLADTAAAAQFLFYAGREWASARRGVDFYDEGTLIWLEADTIIRRRSAGARSLDDFCRRFHGGGTGPPEVRPYGLDEVIETLNAVEPYDWRAFFAERVEAVAPHAPLAGVEASGWRLSTTPTRPKLFDAIHEVNGTLDFGASLGLKVDGKSGMIADVDPDSAAGRAGIGPGMRLVAVNGRRFDEDVVRDALRATRQDSGPLQILVENADWFRTFDVAWRGGDVYPALERDETRPDLLSEILAPRTGAAAK